MHLAHIFNDGFVKLVACHLDRGAGNDAAQRDHRDVSRTAADVDDHHAVRLGNIDARADGCRNRFFHQINVLAACLSRRLFDRALFHFGHAARYADHDLRLEETSASAGLADEVLEHSLRNIVIGDHAVAQRSDRDNVRRSSSEHLSCFFPDGQDLVGIVVDRDDRRLIEDDPFSFDVYEYIGCT